ncbi:MAG: carotenoid biosynthesis protein [Spirochaetota bacterium]|nr:carotenoid biosynthesis protein [Spirochaetota bacterium]
MEEIFKLILSTLILRPYVFAFLIVYFFIAYLFFGGKRLIVYTFLAWVLAFLSEYSSIHTGFPYGDYKYTYFTQVINEESWKLGTKEIFLFGVIPFIDSLSYTFLTFIGYALSVYIFSPIIKLKNSILLADTNNIRHSLRVAFVGAILVTFMDIIIDPIATMGNKWFLGEIHYYNHPGIYFGVPISNFLGWFFTSFVIIFCFQQTDKFLLKGNFYNRTKIPHFKLKVPFLILFYFGVILFNLLMTFYVSKDLNFTLLFDDRILYGEQLLGIIGILIQVPIIILIILPIIRSHNAPSKEEIKKHLNDFPNERLRNELDNY